jgi:hypothetical protein
VLVIVIGVGTVLVGVLVHRPIGVRVGVPGLSSRFVFVLMIGIRVTVLVPVDDAVGMRVGVSVLVFRRHERLVRERRERSPRRNVLYGWC